MQSTDTVPHGFTVKIADFGLATRASNVEYDSETGTYSYLAPEVMKDGLISEVNLRPAECWIFVPS